MLRKGAQWEPRFRAGVIRANKVYDFYHHQYDGQQRMLLLNLSSSYISRSYSGTLLLYGLCDTRKTSSMMYVKRSES